jgi:hypothetical protein
MEDGYAYLVGADPPVQTIGDTGRPRHRRVVAERRVGDLFLTRSLQLAHTAYGLDGVILPGPGMGDGRSGRAADSTERLLSATFDRVASVCCAFRM